MGLLYNDVDDYICLQRTSIDLKFTLVDSVDGLVDSVGYLKIVIIQCLGNRCTALWFCST